MDRIYCPRKTNLTEGSGSSGVGEKLIKNKCIAVANGQLSGLPDDKQIFVAKKPFPSIASFWQNGCSIYRFSAICEPYLTTLATAKKSAPTREQMCCQDLGPGGRLMICEAVCRV
jgi:hypothetical protein